MPQQFLLHLPDGTQYGPIDRPTLEAWHREGRLPEDTLVWPEGAPEWVSLPRALEAPLASPAAATPAPASHPSALRPPAAPVAPKPKPKAAAAPRTARPLAPAAPAQGDDPKTRPSMRMPAFDGKAPAPGGPAEAKARPPAMSAADRRRLLLAGVGLALVAVLVAGMFALLRPFLAKRRAVAEVRRYALAERRVQDPGSGLVVELPAGWLALRNENP